MDLQKDRPDIWSVDELLAKDLRIPSYQRPYKWGAKNITDLILDIQKSIEDGRKYPHFKYRVGTVILYRASDTEPYEVVDGQQRLLSFLLLKLYLQPDFSCALLSTKFSDKLTQKNLNENSKTIREWFSSVDEATKAAFKRALSDTLEVVVLTVNELSEAFQLFDSQNTRGRELYPHDLLKAYHLREIRDKYDMERAVLKWESKDPKAIRELFDNYLFPLWNWANKTMPYFLLTEPLISGRDFFEMVDHYMQMLHSVKRELIDNPHLAMIKKMLIDNQAKRDVVNTPAELDRACKSPSIGMNHARQLFFCALLCYYDRFHNFDPKAVKKLFTWAMMLRVDMKHLGFDSVNRYAIGFGDKDSYSNMQPVISLISNARRHTEVAGLSLKLVKEPGKAKSENWQKLYDDLLELNGYK